MYRKLSSGLLAAATVAAGLLTAGCGSPGSGQPVTYAPAAYGQNGQCYYVSSPAEAVALEQAGLCPPGWVPAPMPLSWQEEYYAYYDSPAYYGTYVPARYRTVYIRTEGTFGTRYRTSIATLASRGIYRSSAGGTVRGYKSGNTRFGSGTSFGSGGRKYGGGSLRSTGRSGGRR